MNDSTHGHGLWEERKDGYLCRVGQLGLCQGPPWWREGAHFPDQMIGEGRGGRGGGGGGQSWNRGWSEPGAKSMYGLVITVISVTIK